MVHSSVSKILSLVGTLVACGLIAACADQRGFRPITYPDGGREPVLVQRNDPDLGQPVAGPSGGPSSQKPATDKPAVPAKSQPGVGQVATVPAATTTPNPVEAAKNNELIHNVVIDYVEATGGGTKASDERINEFIQGLSPQGEVSSIVQGISSKGRVEAAPGSIQTVEVLAMLKIKDGTKKIAAKADVPMDTMSDLGVIDMMEKDEQKKNVCRQNGEYSVCISALFCKQEICKGKLTLLLKIDFDDRHIRAIFIEDSVGGPLLFAGQTPFPSYDEAQAQEHLSIPAELTNPPPAPGAAAATVTATGSAQAGTGGSVSANIKVLPENMPAPGQGGVGSKDAAMAPTADQSTDQAVTTPAAAAEQPPSEQSQTPPSRTWSMVAKQGLESAKNYLRTVFAKKVVPAAGEKIVPDDASAATTNDNE